MRATTPDAVAVAVGLLDGLGAVEAAAVVFRVLGDAVVALGLGAVVRAGCQGAVAFGLGLMVFLALAETCVVGLALAETCGVVLARAEALGVVVALGAADAVPEGSPAWSAFQGRAQFASFHQSFVFHESFAAVFLALSERCPPLSGQLVQAMAADGMPTVPTATAAMTIRR
ncbi:hypothetical protein [Streptomyces sp. NBC_00631]|uniref:hypothetical protein n=1 Tax=Streptomyces sp. NBC_00631 TaxID=2975793 RepID=UPI00386815F0